MVTDGYLEFHKKFKILSMKQLLLILVGGVLLADVAQSQDFITDGKIEFEIKRNNKRWFNDRHPGADLGAFPEFDVSTRELVFSGNQLLYLPAHKAGTKMVTSESSLYTNLDTRHIVAKHSFMLDPYLMEDSIHTIKWKLDNEVRKIAGFECRKAVGRYHDSIYVVAFYCPEIIPQGGPEFFTGLPGMILGLAIPRLYTTWFATRVELTNGGEEKITPPTLKNTPLLKKQELVTIMYKKYEDSQWVKDLSPEKVSDLLDLYTF